MEMTKSEVVDQIPICIIDRSIETGSSRWVSVFDGSYTLAGYSDISTFRAALENGKRFSLLLLAMTDISEWKILSAICQSANLPVIVMLRDEHWQEFSVPGTVSGFTVDTVVWNVGTMELRWRVTKILKNRYSLDGQINEVSSFTWGDYRFVNDVDTVVFHRGQRVRLQRRQFLFALILFKNIRRVVSRDQLTDFFRVDKEKKTTSRALDVCAVNIRKKLQLNPESGLVLRAIYGHGYQLLPTADMAASSA